MKEKIRSSKRMRMLPATIIRVPMVVCIWLCCLLPMMTNGQVTMRLSADTIVLGEETVLTMSGLKGGGEIAVGGDRIEVLQVSFDALHGEQRVVVTSYDPGTRYIRVGEDSLQLEVQGVAVDERSEDPKDIADIADVADLDPEKDMEGGGWLWLYVLAGIAVLTVTVWMVLKKRRGTPVEVPTIAQEDGRTAKERALERLEALRRQRLWQSGETKAYYTGLTEALRLFIEESSGIRATEQTSEETMECMSRLMKENNSDETCEEERRRSLEWLKDILTTSDYVKFAKWEPQEEEHERMFEMAVAFVKNTNFEGGDRDDR